MSNYISPENEDVFYRLSTGVAMESFEDGALLLRLSDCHLFELNTTARHILDLSANRSQSQVAAELAREYDIPFDSALGDIIELFHQLAPEGLVEKVFPDPIKKEDGHDD